MDNNLRRAFKNISAISPDSGLAGRVLARVEAEKNRQMRRKLAWSYAGLVGSLAAGFFAVLNFGREILQADFWSIISLLFSDMEIVVQNFGEFSLSLLETFPAVSLAIIMIPMFALLLSFSTYLKSIKRSHYNYI